MQENPLNLPHTGSEPEVKDLDAPEKIEEAVENAVEAAEEHHIPKMIPNGDSDEAADMAFDEDHLASGTDEEGGLTSDEAPSPSDDIDGQQQADSYHEDELSGETVAMEPAVAESQDGAKLDDTVSMDSVAPEPQEVVGLDETLPMSPAVSVPHVPPITPETVEGAVAGAAASDGSEPKKKSVGKKIAIAIVVVLCLLGGIGGGIAYAIDLDNKKNIEFFEEHFFDNSSIMGVDVSRMDADEAQATVQEKLDSISVTVKDDKNTDKVDGAKLEMALKDDDVVSKLIEEQDEQSWRDENTKQHEYDSAYDYDHGKLDEFVNGLACVSGADRTDPVDAKLDVEGGQVVIVKGVDGNKVDGPQLAEEIDAKLNAGGGEIDATAYYIPPKWKGDEPEFEAAKEKADKWTSARIDYTIDMIPHAAVVDGATIVEFIDIDNENIDVSLDEEKIKEWFGENTRSFDTVGTERQYTTPSGETISLSGGHYGWMTDEAAELPLLVESIENGETVERDFSYEQTAAGPKGGQEWGNTYIDIDITAQTVSYIRNGEVLLKADTVTGNEDPGHETQRGFYSVLWKDSPHVMVGDIVPSTGRPEYTTPCTFFILFNYNGSACHDADSIRSDWSKSAHFYNGSHGCANMHYSDVAQLWDLCEHNDPVIVHD